MLSLYRLWRVKSESFSHPQFHGRSAKISMIIPESCQRSVLGLICILDNIPVDIKFSGNCCRKWSPLRWVSGSEEMLEHYGRGAVSFICTKCPWDQRAIQEHHKLGQNNERIRFLFLLLIKKKHRIDLSLSPLRVCSSVQTCKTLHSVSLWKPALLKIWNDSGKENAIKMYSKSNLCRQVRYWSMCKMIRNPSEVRSWEPAWKAWGCESCWTSLSLLT